MFDGLGHGKPFIASNLGLSKEFSNMNLGIVSKRNPRSFEQAFSKLDKNYTHFQSHVQAFREKIKCDNIAERHISIYNSIINKSKAPAKIIQRTSSCS